MEPKIIRKGISVGTTPDFESWSVTLNFHDDNHPKEGFTHCRVHVSIPKELAEKLTLPDLYTEAFKRFDAVKHLL